MAEGGPEDARDIQSLREELKQIQKEIEHARKQKDTKEKLRREIEKAKQELADLTSDKEDNSKSKQSLSSFFVQIRHFLIWNERTKTFNKWILNVAQLLENKWNLDQSSCEVTNPIIVAFTAVVDHVIIHPHKL